MFRFCVFIFVFCSLAIVRHLPPQTDQNKCRIRYGHVNMTPAVEKVRHNGQKNHTDRPEHLKACVDNRARSTAGDVVDCERGVIRR